MQWLPANRPCRRPAVARPVANWQPVSTICSSLCERDRCPKFRNGASRVDEPSWPAPVNVLCETMTNILSMRAFVQTVNAGSLSAGGRALGISSASISRRVSALEEELGVRLLNRSSRSLSLTPAGEEYFARAASILEQIDEARRVANEFKVNPKGLLKVHSRTGVGVQIITPALKQFAEDNPDITVELVLSESSVNLLQDGYDVDIRIGELNDSMEVVSKLSGAERLLVASEQYLSRNPPILTPEDLSEHNCLTYKTSIEYSHWKFAKGDTMKEVPVSGNLRTNNGEVLRGAAISGQGVAVLNDWTVLSDVQSGRLKRVLPDYRVTQSSFDTGIYAVFHQKKRTPLNIRQFVDYLKAAIRRQREGAGDEQGV